jgi:hypothetical protein
MLADHRDVLSWSDVVARNPVIFGLDVEASGQFVGAGEAVASAHGKILSSSPFVRLFDYNQFP